MGRLEVRWAAVYLRSAEHTEAELLSLVGGPDNVTSSGGKGDRGVFGGVLPLSSVAIEERDPGGSADDRLRAVIERTLAHRDEIQRFAVEASGADGDSATLPAVLELVLARFGDDTRLDLSPQTLLEIAKLGLPFRITTYVGGTDLSVVWTAPEGVARVGPCIQLATSSPSRDGPAGAFRCAAEGWQGRLP